MMQAIGLALRLRVMEILASAGERESSRMRAARVLSMNSWTEGSRPSSVSKLWMVGSAIAVDLARQDGSEEDKHTRGRAQVLFFT